MNPSIAFLGSGIVCRTSGYCLQKRSVWHYAWERA